VPPTISPFLTLSECVRLARGLPSIHLRPFYPFARCNPARSNSHPTGSLTTGGHERGTCYAHAC
jgi:hypothetical protein